MERICHVGRTLTKYNRGFCMGWITLVFGGVVAAMVAILLLLLLWQPDG
jgi:hypothetical protein